MPGIVADADCRGQLQVILRLFQDDARREVWEWLALDVVTLEDLLLPTDASDRLVWETCQQRELALVTANRNAEAPESLENTIRQSSGPDSLPVITLADPQRILIDRSYAAEVADRLLDYLFDLENLRGTGRLFVP